MCYRGETPSAPSVTTGSCLEYTFSGGYAKTPKYRRFLAQALPLRDEQGAVVKWYGVLTPLDGEPQRRGPRPRAAKVDYYPLCDSEGYLHLVEVTVWQDRPDNPGAKYHPSGAWYRVELVAESVWQASD